MCTEICSEDLLGDELLQDVVQDGRIIYRLVLVDRVRRRELWPEFIWLRFGCIYGFLSR